MRDQDNPRHLFTALMIAVLVVGIHAGPALGSPSEATVTLSQSDAESLGEPASTGIQSGTERCEKAIDENDGQGSLTFAASCSASATCWNGTTVSCSALGSTNCSSADHNCSIPRDGFVRCGFIFKSCPGCPGGGSGACSQGASCTSSVECGSDGQCAGGTCWCD